MSRVLTRQELDRWLGFRYMVEEASLAVSRDLSSSTGMTGGQFGILSVLVNEPEPRMRQQQIADAMRWDRTRLSHQLTRMAKTGWILRDRSESGRTLVSITTTGRNEQRRVAPILGEIVRRKFLNLLTQTQFATLEEIRRVLASEGSGSARG